MQDMKDNIFAETEPALALKEIRSRDPNFDMVKFLYNLKVDVPVVIQAYLRGQVDILKEHCSKDMVERLSGIIAAQTAQVCLCKCLGGCKFSRVCPMKYSRLLSICTTPWQLAFCWLLCLPLAPFHS